MPPVGRRRTDADLASPDLHKDVLRHLDKLKPRWLEGAPQDMVNTVSRDWQAWKKSGFV